MKELFRQRYAAEHKNTQPSQLVPIDIEALENEFEEKWRSTRRSRIIRNNDDGTNTTFEVYRFSITTTISEAQQEEHLIDFTSTAIILGYRPSISPVIIQPPSRGFGHTPTPNIFFFFERTEAVNEHINNST